MKVSKDSLVFVHHVDISRMLKIFVRLPNTSCGKSYAEKIVFWTCCKQYILLEFVLIH